MELLDPLVMMVVVIASLATVSMVRRGLWRDAPIIILAALLAAAGILALTLEEGLVSMACVLVAVLGGFALETLPAALDPLTRAAHIRGRLRRARWLELAQWASRPTWARRVSWQTARLTDRVARGVQDGRSALNTLQELLATLEGERRPRTARHLARIEPRVIEATTAVRAVQGHWSELASIFERDTEQFTRYLARRPTRALVDFTRALCECGHLGAAVALIDACNGSILIGGGEGERCDAFRSQARLTLLSFMGGVEVIERARRRDSALRPIFDRPGWEALIQRASGTQAPAPDSPQARVLAECAEALALDARLPSSLASLYAPPASLVVLAVVLSAIHLAVTLTGDALDPHHLLAVGGHHPIAVEAGQRWRLITSTFIHAGVVHLGFNLAFLWIFGNTLERLIGSARFLGLYLLAGFGGAWVAVEMGANLVGVGASGAIFGVLGGCFPVLLSARGRVPRPWFVTRLVTLIGVLVLNLYLGAALEFVSLSAHLGGFVVGALVGAVAVAVAGKAPEMKPAGGTTRGLVALLWLSVVGFSALGLAREMTTPPGEAQVAPRTLTGTTLAPGGEPSRAALTVPLPVTWLVDPVQAERSPQAWPWVRGQGVGLRQVRVHCGAALRLLVDGAELDLIPPNDSQALMAWAPEECRPAEAGFVLCRRAQPSGVLLTASRREPDALVQLVFLLDADLEAPFAPLLSRILPDTRPAVCLEP